MKDKSGPREYSMLKPPEELHHNLLGWFDTAKRSMPWRETRDPYAIWLSETMLQQTQVETVKPYYRRFLERFPTVADLARADLQEVLSLWAGLGYYRRAKHLHQAAQRMVEKHGGQVPGVFEELISLPGVGRYTAGAVGSIAFGLPVAVVDGNVMRVLSRLTGYDKDIADPKNAGFFWEVAGRVLAGATAAGEEGLPVRYGDVNQGLMELGATICTPPPSMPACLLCPVRGFCRAYAEGRQGELPVKKKKGEVPVVRGVALVVVREVEAGRGKGGREVLVMQRPMGTVWEGMWEFPVVEGRDVKDGRALAGWVGEVLGLGVARAERCGEVRHGLTHRTMIFEVVKGEEAEGRRQEAEAGELPRCATAGGERYVAARWVGWPLEKGGGVPLARVVWKVAEAAQAVDAPGNDAPAND